MAIKLGIHTGPQDLTFEELRRLWQRADEAGFHWISVWDHFYANPLNRREDPCFEAVASMAALAALTRNVRVGCLMFCSWFRPPGVLAKAAVTIDHVSGGRANLGIGGGWFEEEFREFGYGFPPIGERLDHLEETLQVVRSLLREPSTTFKGKYHHLENAVCGPKPMNPKLKLWVGGRGPKRTPAIAARYADGFNTPYIAPDQFARRMSAIDQACERIGRDPGEVERSVNLGFYTGVDRKSADAKRAALESSGHAIAKGSLVGLTAEAIDRIGEYERAGAQGLNIAFRPPVDWDAFEAFIEEVLPVYNR